MALLLKIVSVLVFALALSSMFELSTSQVLKGKLTCLDCSTNFDFSGIKVRVRCDQVKQAKPQTTMTNKKGVFEVDLPKTSTSSPLNCLARILGGPIKLYVKKENMMSQIIKSTQDASTCTISTPLAFYINMKDTKGNIVSSKTVDLPVPRQWGLPPSSYFTPFIPIIGIP